MTATRSARHAALSALPLVLGTGAYLWTRLYRLTVLPMFFDEATHLLWAERLHRTGRSPSAIGAGKILQTVVTAVTAVDASDPLWAGRLTTAFFGLLTFWGAYRLGQMLGGRGVAALTAAFYVASPFALFYERLNLTDAYVACFTTWALVSTLSLWRRPSGATATALGLSLGGSVLAKVTGGLAFLLPPAAAVLLRDRQGRPRGEGPWRWLVLAYVLAALIVAVPIVRFVTEGGEIRAKAYSGESAWTELFAENLGLAAGWLFVLWTPPICLWLAVGAVRSWRPGRSADRLALVAALLPAVAFSAVLHSWFPRYLLPATAPALALGSRALWDIAGFEGGGAWRRLVGSVLVAATLVPGIRLDARILGDPTKAALPEIERFQYVEGWPSGYGWREAAELLRDEQRRTGKPIGVLSDPDHPTLPAHFRGDARFRVRGLDGSTPEAQAFLRESLAAGPTYIVTSASTARPPLDPDLTATHLAGFAKPGRQVLLNVYRVGLAARPAGDREAPPPGGEQRDDQR